MTTLPITRHPKCGSGCPLMDTAFTFVCCHPIALSSTRSNPCGITSGCKQRTTATTPASLSLSPSWTAPYPASSAGQRKSRDISILSFKGYVPLFMRCCVNAESELLLPPVLNDERLRQQFLDILTHKSPAWAYEREVRMIYERGQADYSRIQSQGPECKEQGRTFAECKNPCYRDAIALPSGAILAVII